MALAAPAKAQSSSLALNVPAGRGQQALALRAEGNAVRARVCASAAGCTPDGGALLPLPEDVRALLPKGKATTVMLAGGRALGHVELPGEGGAAWRMLIAAPLAGKGSEPLILWSGWTGVPHGEHGEERSAAVVVEAAADGTRVLIGEHRADVTLCGRPTLVGAKEVDPSTMQLGRATSVQNLTAADRAAATKISATRATGEAPKSEARALRATAASSAVEKKLASITDGDAATAWSENKPGDGSGEFVSMSAPEEVGINALDVVVRPTEDVSDGAAPKRFYVATASKLFEVTMPEDAWKQPPGTRYSVKLPAPEHTACLAVVLDTSYAPAGKAAARVSIAEVTARTGFDGSNAEALAGALAGGGERAKGAAAMLARAGEAGMKAAIAAYDKLDDAGRQLASQVIDAAPCKDQAAFFAARFAAATAVDPNRPKPAPGEVDPELAHARDRLRRCGRASTGALVKLVTEGSPRAKVAAADELSAIAPDAAVPALLDAMASADEPTRRDLRAALARAAKSPRALPALREEVTKAKLDARSEVVAIDLFRAIGPMLGKVDGAADAFAALVAKSTSERARYLLQVPAAELARTGEKRAEAYLREALRKDAEAYVRARAAEAAAAVPGLVDDLVAAIDDTNPRVREAAIGALAAGNGSSEAQPKASVPSGLGAALGRRLAGDDWTFVRASAARALGALPADAAIDVALAAALGDRSTEVRGRALDGLGAHRAKAHLEAIRARQDDAEEDVEVRARAILALGALCDTRSVETWTKLAHGAKVPMEERDRRLGGAAVAALGDVHPADLATRLAPLLDKDTPVPLREMVKAALAAQGSCK
ncbi:HEAT repeat protein [Minicystis rosea]|nr:HEAT repeat protein [Minicystis rosea]